MDSLKLNIPQSLFVLAQCETFSGEFDLGTLSVGPDDFVFEEPLQWQVSVTNTGGALLLMGDVSGTARTECARCIEPFRFDVVGTVEGYFLIPGEEAEGLDEELGEDEFETLPEDSTIDLEPILKAAILLELPLVPLCGEDCLGLCPQCGANLNDGACDCEPEEEERVGANNPFGVLKSLKFD